MNIKLKDCPFCGREAQALIDFHEYTAFMRVGCVTCNIEFRRDISKMNPLNLKAADTVCTELAEQWNTRKDESNTNSAEDLYDGWDWIATTENYMCDNCKEISPEPHKYCPNCKQFMRNYKTV